MSIFVFLLMSLGIIFGFQEVWAFNLFSARTKDVNIKLWNEYVKESSVDDTIIGTTLANVTLGAGKYHGNKSVKSVLNLSKTAETLVNVDILELLKWSQDPESTLKMHLKHIEKTTEEIHDTVETLQEESQKYMQDSQVCLQEKKAGDRLFFQWLQRNDEIMMQEWLDQSLEAWPCYITNRIKANASWYMAYKAGAQRALLSKRQKLLSTKWDLLIKHKEYLEGNILEELLQLKQQLRSLNTVSVKNVQAWWAFNNIFDPSWKISELPNFSSIIPLDGYPTYQDPWNWKR